MRGSSKQRWNKILVLVTSLLLVTSSLIEAAPTDSESGVPEPEIQPLPEPIQVAVETGDNDETSEDADQLSISPPLPPLPPMPPLPPLPPVPTPTEETPVCHDSLVGQKGLFASPKFPDDYPNNSNCTWDILGPQFTVIKLSFHLMEVENHASCIWDWIKVFEGNGTLIKHFCGNLQQELTITSSTNKIKVQFKSDSVVQQSGFLATWNAVSPSSEDSPQEEGPVENKPSYMFTFPRGFTANTLLFVDPSKIYEGPYEKVCLQFSNVKEAGTTGISLYSAQNILSNEATFTKFVSYDPAVDPSLKCFTFSVNAEFGAEGKAIIGIQGKFGDYQFVGFKSVRVVKPTPLAMIQTDMYDYKPSQKVNVRMLVMNSQLQPSTKLTKVSEMFVKDPADNRIAQWRDVELKNGLAQVSMSLDAEPLLGRYTIEARASNGNLSELLDSKSFKVSERVLPKFEVQIKGPKSILRDSTGEEYKVCGIYTHGGKVKGTADVTFKATRRSYYRSNGYETINKSSALSSDGCAAFSLTAGDYKILQRGVLGSITIDSNVTESGTSTVEAGTLEVDIKNTHFQIQLEGNSKTHDLLENGGFPYVGKLKVLSHATASPLESKRLEICARFYTSIDDLRAKWYEISGNYYRFTEERFYELGKKLIAIKQGSFCQEHVTDADGMVKFSVALNDVPSNVTKLSIKAAALDYLGNVTTGMQQTMATFDVDLQRSNGTKTAVTIGIQDPAKFECGDNTVNVYYTSLGGKSAKLSWYLTSAGSILDQEVVELQANERDHTNEYTDGAQELQGEAGSGSQKMIIHKHALSINISPKTGRRISEQVKLLVQVHGDNGVATTRRDYEFVSCAAVQKLTWDKSEVRPREAVQLKVEEGLANAACAYSVVDKSVTLVGNPNKVTAPKLQALRETLADKKIGPPSSGGKCKNSDHASFDELGLSILTDRKQKSEDGCSATFVEIRAPVPGGPDSPPYFAYAEESYGAPAAEADYATDLTTDYNDGPPGAPIPVVAQAMAAPPPPPEAFSAPAGDVGREPPIAMKNKIGELVPILEEPKVELRNYFPETWLFDLVDLDGEGKTALELEAPDTITTWVGDSVCLSPLGPATVSQSAELLVSQDFFADIVLPYSVKRGEIFPLNVSVFSTVDQQLPVRLAVRQSQAIKIGRPSSDVCLAPNDNTIESFTVKAKELNEVNITVEAKLASTSGCQLSDPQAEGFTDALVKSIIVKPEGFPVEKTQSEFVCRQATDEPTEIELDPLVLPSKDDLVDGSERAFITVTGDIMAPALSNLEKLVQVPYGCGEQNMISVVPNIYLLEYLKGKGISLPATESLAKKYMRQGWERQQKYRHKDGSYSIWGPNDEEGEGSMWLTAFVVKTFAQASKFIDIDESKLIESARWVLSNQNRSTGCYINKGYTIHPELKGPSLTASVVVAMNEVKAILSRSRQNSRHSVELSKSLSKAMKCIQQQNNTGIYTKALAAYAVLTFADQTEIKVRGDAMHAELNDFADTLLEELKSQGNETLPGKLFWSTGKDNRARDVELTAYMVLNLVHKERLSEALKAIRWLATQRNSRGGFVSTQDTMVALQAISVYSSKIRKQDTSLDIVASVHGGDDNEETVASTNEFQISEDNQLLFEKVKIPLLSQSSSLVKISVKGQGCFMAQSILKYNVKRSPEKEVFKLTVGANLDNQKEVLKVCAGYDGGKAATDMVVIEIEMLSGYEPYLSALESLVRRRSPVPVKKYEYDEKEGRVVLYFNSMDREINCWDFPVKQVADIQELKPALVKIYDYYDPKEAYSTSYLNK